MRSLCLHALATFLLISACERDDGKVPGAPGAPDDETRSEVPATNSSQSLPGAKWQSIAETALTRSGEAGVVVVLDATEGKLLALAQKEGRVPEPANVPRHPASSVKPFLAIAALAQAKLRPAETITCDGPREIGGETFTCFHRHGEVDLERGMRTSCNHFAYQLAARLSDEEIAKHFKTFGLGVPSGLLPKELGEDQAGHVPLGTGKNSAAIGHGELRATPLQIAKAYATLATGRIPARVHAPLPYPNERLDRVRHALIGTVENPEGSGTGARVEGLSIAGKTGTSELDPSDTDDSRYLSWFAGWAPAKDPEVIVVVQLESKETAGESAAPLASQVFEGLVADGANKVSTK